MIVNRYDTGGNLQSVHGRLNGQAYQYLKSLTYDRFESRVRLELANGMVTRYRYNDATRRLENLKAGKGSGTGNDLQDPLRGSLTHESLHRGKGQYIRGTNPSHRKLDDNARALVKQWG